MFMLSKDAKFSVGVTRSSASTAAVSTAPYDMSGYDGIAAFAVYGTANSGNYLKAQMAASTASTSMEDLTGTANGVGSSDEQQWSDVYRPTKRYVRFQAIRAGASSLLDGIWVVQYGDRKKPATSVTSGTIYGEGAASPSTGTA